MLGDMGSFDYMSDSSDESGLHKQQQYYGLDVINKYIREGNYSRPITLSQVLKSRSNRKDIQKIGNLLGMYTQPNFLYKISHIYAIHIHTKRSYLQHIQKYLYNIRLQYTHT